MAVVPAPLPIAPSQTFDGDDGNWSSFTIRVGNPAQDVRVLVSTLVPETWVVLPAGCTLNDPDSCDDSRGGLFDPSRSTTWLDQGTWSIVEESALGYGGTSDRGDYGYDTLGIQIEGNTNGGVALSHQVIVALAVKDFYLGNLGLNPRTPAFNSSTQISFLESLLNASQIPSLTYGYTAGAYYRSGTYGSLTLGGYDASRLIANDVTFSLSAINTHDLVVGVQSISYADSNTDDLSLVSYGDGFQALIDSTLPSIWLPVAACDAFSNAFGLTFNSLKLIYTINDTMHDANLKNNASVTFQLANFVTGGDYVNITLPYASFDLNLTTNYPGITNTTAYFPLRQAQDPSQYTIGRAFLQEAYLTVDYERKNFSVSQCDFSGRPSHIVAISSVNATTTPPPSPTPSGVTPVNQNSSSGLSSSAIAGIAIGIIALAIILAGAVIFMLWRKRRARRRVEAAELPGDDLSKMDRSNSSRSHHKWLPLTPWGHKNGEKVTTVHHEHAGREISVPQPERLELSGGEVERAELHSPPPPESDPISPQSGQSQSDLPIHSNYQGAESPELMPSPVTTATPSAFQSPRIPNTFPARGRTSPMAHSPGGDGGGLSPESEKGNFILH